MKNRILLIFQGKNAKFVDTKTYFETQISAYFRYFSSYKQVVFSAIEARVTSGAHLRRGTMPRVLKQETVVLLQPYTLVFLPKWSPNGTSVTSEEAPFVRAPRRRAGTLKVRTRPQKPVKTNPKVSSVLPRLIHTSEVQNGVQQKYNSNAELDLKSAK